MFRCEGLTKSYPGRPPLFQDVNFKIDKGEFFYLSGVSGAGKTTIFKMFLLLERPDMGAIRFGEREITHLSARQRAAHRRRIGMVFQDQDNRLLAGESVENNVALPLRIGGLSGREMRLRVHKLLEQVGLAERKKEPVRGLSGGEKQLVSIARALVFNPEVFLADEPTGNLDQNVALKVMTLLRAIHQTGCTVVVATHDLSLIRRYRARTLLIKARKLHEVRLTDPGPGDPPLHDRLPPAAP